MISGQLPDGLAHCESLGNLDLSGNMFQWIIPSTWNSLKSLQVLNVSQNGLSGEIPRFLQLNLLQSLDLSLNDFEGLVPSEGIFRNESAIALKGNEKLCGGITELKLPSCHFQSKKKRIASSINIIIATVSAFLAVSFQAMIFFFYYQRKKRQQPTSIKPESSFMEISYHNLLKATNGLSSTNLIGVGSFGSVYKGILDTGEIVVAIKVLNLLRGGASKSFLTECEALQSIRHRNIVKILTVCSGIDRLGNEFKALIYDFMSNGSLEEWLHDDAELNDSQERAKNLNLFQRLSLAIDVASALDYLHNQCATPLVHCDLKPSNILLDDQMVAHLGDFELVRFLQEETPNSLTNETSSIGIRGTVG